MILKRLLISFIFLLQGSIAVAMAEDLPERAAASPKQPWGEFTTSPEVSSNPWWMHALYWIPNRVMDFIDIFRVDLGVGPSIGAVARVSKYGQVGYRTMHPASIRLGDFGRKAPFLVEHSSEFGIGPGYVDSNDRQVCPGEFGLGADLFIVGGYGGVCTEEVFDFVTGLFFLDLMDDDLR